MRIALAVEGTRGDLHRMLALGISVRAYMTAHANALVGGPLRALRKGARYFRTCIQAQFRCLP